MFLAVNFFGIKNVFNCKFFGKIFFFSVSINFNQNKCQGDQRATIPSIPALENITSLWNTKLNRVVKTKEKLWWAW